MSVVAPAMRHFGGKCRTRVGAAHFRPSLIQSRTLSIHRFGSSIFGSLFASAPENNTICNCGAGLGNAIPQHELVVREGLERGSTGWTRQTYGAALYWHLASTRNERDIDPDILRGKDVLEVGCMLGGGARYLAEVVQAKSYVATDISEEFIVACRKLNSPLPGLRYEVADASRLEEYFEPESFDAIIGIEIMTHLSGDDLLRFLVVAAKTLRPGGRLAVCDLFEKNQLGAIIEAAKACGFTFEAQQDMSKYVDFVGICRVTRGDTYTRLVAIKTGDTATTFEGDGSDIVDNSIGKPWQLA